MQEWLKKEEEILFRNGGLYVLSPNSVFLDTVYSQSLENLVENRVHKINTRLFLYRILT